MSTPQADENTPEIVAKRVSEGSHVLVPATVIGDFNGGLLLLEKEQGTARFTADRYALVSLDVLRDVLRKCEWAHTRPENIYCPVCGIGKYRSGVAGDDNDHADGCALAALLAQLSEG